MEPKNPVIIKGKPIDRMIRIDRIHNRMPRSYPRRSVRRSLSKEVRRSVSGTARGSMGRLMSRPAGRPISRPAGRPRSSNIEVPEINRYVKVVRRVIISVLILALIFIFNSINTKFTKGIINSVKSVLAYNLNFEETLGKLKFVENYVPDISEVFGNQNGRKEDLTFTAPIQGTVLAMYGDSTAFGGELINEGIDILAEEKSEFYAAADGTIASIEVHDVFGKSLWVQHGDGYFTFYGGCDDLSVTQGQKIKKGDKIGSVAPYNEDKYILHFEIWQEDKTVNPLEHIHTEDDVSKL